MSNWPIIAAANYQVIGQASGAGTVLTAGTSSAKGTIVTLGTTNFKSSGLYLCLTHFSATSRYRIDVIVNDGGSDQVIIEDYYLDLSATNAIDGGAYFPVSVPSGASIKARLSSSTNAATLICSVVLVATDFPGAPGSSRVRSLTDFTNVAPTNTVTLSGTTPTAWTQIAASTIQRISWLWAQSTAISPGSGTISDVLIDLATGGAGSEKAFATFQSRTIGSGGFTNGKLNVPCDIPSGTRLSFRATCSGANAQTGIGCCCNGLAA